MAARTLLVAFYSGEGHRTAKMARYIAQGAEAQGVKVNLKEAEECRPQDLLEADGVALGSPTYFSNMAWQVKKLIDESIALYRDGHRLQGRVAGVFTSAGARADGEECLRALVNALGSHHRMRVVPGIVCLPAEAEEALAESSRAYGERLAQELLAK